MITTRIATAVALLTFSLAGFGATVVAIAAPARAETTSVTQIHGTAMTGTAGPAIEDASQIPDELQDATRGPDVTAVPTPGSAATQQHLPFPHDAAPHSEHNGQGHKGTNEHHGR
jgi:predicted secreted Zn-dependent protease